VQQQLKMNLRLLFLAMSTSQQQQKQPPPVSPIIVVGLNGALQKRFVLSPGDSLVPGNVLRAVQVQEGVGGKGQDVSIALDCLSKTSPQQLVQFIGRGPAGDAVHQMMVERLGEAAMGLTVRSSTDLRTCTSIVATDETTELVEPSGVITEKEMEELFSKAARVNNQARGVCIMGSMPPGCPSDTYAKLYSQVAGISTVCVVDSVAGIDDLLQTASKMRRNVGPTIFKVNASELCKLAGTSKSKSETGGVEQGELTNAVQQFVSKYSPHVPDALLGLAITDGRHPSYFVSFVDEKEFQLFRILVPKLDPTRTLYPIGAGDAVAAGTLAAWVSLTAPTPSNLETVPKACFELLSDGVKKIDHVSSSVDVARAVTAFSFGLVCGSASCLQEENSVLDTADVERLLRTMQQPELLLTQALAK
jgi:fructose-1-phosphate kinase PfkB-like protein